jgi:GNAT superfamily N-acetyltransferase
MLMDIDFDNINHINYIMKLAKRNNYYQLQLLSSIEEYYKTNGSLRVDYVDFKGLFYIENKKVLGFIIYQFIDKQYIKVDFMLIDKSFQNKGYGKQLINKVISIRPSFIVIECEKDTKDYYIKNFNFFELRKDNLKNPKDISENERLCQIHFIREIEKNYNFCYVYKL